MCKGIVCVCARTHKFAALAETAHKICTPAHGVYFNSQVYGRCISVYRETARRRADDAARNCSGLLRLAYNISVCVCMCVFTNMML
jgi:hypothetical protein